MSKEHHLGQMERDKANRERITQKNDAIEAETRRPARKIEIINPTIFDDEERNKFFFKELKNIVGNIKHIENLFANTSQDNMFAGDLEESIPKEVAQIKANLTTMYYAIPMIKSGELIGLSEAFKAVKLFSIDYSYGYSQFYQNFNDIKSDFDKHKEELYFALGYLIEYYKTKTTE